MIARETQRGFAQAQIIYLFGKPITEKIIMTSYAGFEMFMICERLKAIKVSELRSLRLVGLYFHLAALGLLPGYQSLKSDRNLISYTLDATKRPVTRLICLYIRTRQHYSLSFSTSSDQYKIPSTCVESAFH